MTSKPTSTPRPFTFDTVFDGGRVISPPKPKRHFTAEEIEAARAAGYAEGERSAVAQAETGAARALGDIAGAVRSALGYLAEAAHLHRTDSARLALACARKIADAALDRFPEQPAAEALAALGRELDAQPRLIVRAAPAEAERMETALRRMAESLGLSSQVVVKTDPTLPRAAFVFDWGDGRAAFDPDAAAARVAATLETALAAEGLHADPLAPAPPAINPEADR
jgi:flagellar assembly protein FliH